MLATLRKRFDRDDEEGFTLIELMVVVLIIAILLAIAIPTFLGARERANDRAAQSNLRNALAAEKVYFTDEQIYSSSTTELEGIEPNLEWTAYGSATDSDAMYVGTTTDGRTLCLQALSRSDDQVWSIWDSAGSSGTVYVKGSIDTCSTTAPTGQTSGFPK